MPRHLSLAVCALLALSVLPTGAAPVAAQPSDRLEREVRDELRGERGLRLLKITTNGGEVTLAGGLDTFWLKSEAIRRALEVDGVETVVSEITLPEGSDRSIIDDVSRAVLNYPYYTVFDYLDGRVEDGVVTLIGRVTNERDKRADVFERVAKVRGRPGRAERDRSDEHVDGGQPPPERPGAAGVQQHPLPAVRVAQEPPRSASSSTAVSSSSSGTFRARSSAGRWRTSPGRPSAYCVSTTSCRPCSEAAAPAIRISSRRRRWPEGRVGGHHRSRRRRFRAMTVPTRSPRAETAPLAAAGWRSRRPRGPFAAAAMAAALAGACACAPPGGDGPRLSRGTDASGVAYVADADCAGCHRPEFDAWTGSHHDLAMQEATPGTVLGDFDDALFSRHGVTSRFFRRGDRFFVNTEGPDGAPADFELTHTLGVEPLQQYLAPFPGGRLQPLPIAWDTARHAWFHLYPDERIEPDDPLHWTGRYQTWNLQCAACHSTDLRKRYDAASDSYDTTWAEIDVGCQACHGPGARHVALAGGGGLPAGGGGDGGGLPAAGGVPAGGGLDGDDVPADGGGEGAVPADAGGAGRALPTGEWGLVAPFSADDPAPELDVCAPCHSRREQLTPVAAHGGPLLDDFLPARLADGLYHPDGQILDEVYVYGSFVQSRMHAAGVRCTDCHDPHRLSLRADGNAVCTQCHRERPVDRFPMLAPGRYDTPGHHHHDPGSPGAQCVACHMPDRTYMGVDPRRDHGFRVPRPDLSVALGTPNACVGCHDDRDDAWAAAVVTGWSAAPPRPHFAPAFAAGRAGDRAAGPDLAALAADPAQPAIVRGTALELLRPLGRTGVAAARAALDDSDPLVRATAAGGLEPLGLPARRAALEPVLADRVRAVRLEAARVLAEAWGGDGAPAPGDPLAAAAAEYLGAQAAVADMAPARLGLGVVRQRQGARAEAEAEYRAALALDPRFTPARFNLANLLNVQGRNPEAETVLRGGIEFAPDEAELHYSLGLLLAEESRLAEAVESLSRAAVPTARARVHYNHGLALQQAGRLEEAEAALREARRRDDRDPDVALALARLLMDQQRWSEAGEFASALVRLAPTAPGPQRLLNEIRLRERRSRR